MSKVTLVLDLDGLGELRPGDVLVESVLDYAAAYAAMCEAIHAQESRRLVVRNRACAAWLCEAQKKYGSEQVAVSRLDYRSLLEERWHLTIPSWIDDRDLAESRLLEWYGLQPAAGQGFEDMLLDEYWHSAFTYDRLPIQRLADLANEYDAKQWSATLQVPVAQKLLSRRLALWEEKATTTGESYLVRLLSRTPERLRPLLSHLRLLQGYPVEVGLRALGAEYSQLRALGLKLEQLSVETTMLERSRDQIRVYLATKRHSAELGQELQAVIGGMSGLLLEEFDWLESLLKNREVEATRELVERIENRFSALRPTLGGRLTELVLFIEPERPSDPAADWGVDQWLFWATQEYLPYRYWQEDTGASSEEMVGYATKYADWLYASFSSLVGGHPNLVYRAILNAGESLQPDNVLLFVMMDNFGYRFASELSELMAARGYRSPTIVPYVSMLPSATVVSKKAMAVGDPYPFMGTAYKAVVEKAWRQRFDRKALYLGRIGDLEALSTLEHCYDSAGIGESAWRS